MGGGGGGGGGGVKSFRIQPILIHLQNLTFSRKNSLFLKLLQIHLHKK